MPKGFEVERKFLLKRLPTKLLTEIKALNILQTYIKLSHDEEIRVRAINNEIFIQTTKRPVSPDDVTREEIEEIITREEYDLLLSKQIGIQIKKSRYKIPGNDGHTYELDIYHGELKGLITVEVEFESAEIAQTFDIPDWFGEEVTRDKRYKNSSLAKNGLPKKNKTENLKIKILDFLTLP